MKKALILILALLMAFTGVAVHAEPADEATEAVEAELSGTVEEANDATEAEDETEADHATEAEDEEEDEEEPPLVIEYDYDELTVGAVTPFRGSFFSDMWGNVTSDLDVRLLLHGYNLVEWSGETGTFALDPSVVSGIIVTENPEGDRTYTFALYSDLIYSDGTPITARDYAFSMLLSIAPEAEEIGASLRPMEYIQGYDAYIPGEAPYLSGIRMLSDDTLAITISHEYLPFFYELAMLDCTPVPMHVVAPGCTVLDDGEGVYIANADPEQEEPLFTADLLRETILDPETGYLSHPMITSGPYKLVSYDGQEVRMEINEYYKGNSQGLLPRIPRLIFRVVSNETMLEELAAGEVGLLNKCVSADILQEGTRLALSTESLSFSNYTRNGMSFISFCCDNAPVDSVAVRQAIAMCLDKDGLVSDTVSTYGLRVDGYYGLGQWMYQLANGTQTYPVEDLEETATDAEIAEHEATLEAWDNLNLSEVRVYELDVEGAVALLVGDGWTLNAEGEPFDPETDEVRCKRLEDGTLLALDLKLLCPEGSSLNANIGVNFLDHLAEAGIRVAVETEPLQELLLSYYRDQPRDCHMIMLATNFDVVFDPSITFMPDGESANRYNVTAIDDETLYQLAADMRQTAPDDALGYCQKWVEFQKRFQEVVPVIPIYSNIYFDFYPSVLHRYDISGNIAWSNAIVGAYMSDVSEEEEAEEEEEEEGDENLVDLGF